MDMKKLIVTVFTIFIFGSSISSSQDTLRKVKNQAFKTSEVLEYRVHYGFLSAGEAKLEVMPELKPMGNRTCYHVVGTGKSVGAFDWFFKVRDNYESYIDTQSLAPWLFIRNVNEGGYKINQQVVFNQYQKTAASQKKTITVPENVQDLVSAFYYARTLDYSKAKEGDTFSFQAYLDDEAFPMSLKFVGRETIKTGLGKFKCLKFHPQLLEGRVFKDKDDMTIWVTDDVNKVVIRAEAEILVGSIKMDLKKYSGLMTSLVEVD